MEKIIEIIGQLADADIEVYLSDQKLKARALKAGMTPYFGSLIKNNKLQIIEYLNHQAQLQQLNIRPPIIPVERNEKYLIPSYAQQRLWFIDKMNDGSTQYNMYSAMHFAGDFKVDVAEAAFRYIIERHEPLRTTFVEGDNGPLQLIKEQFNFSITQIDICHLSNDEKDTAIKAAVKQDAEKAFDLDNDLMLRVSYLQIEANEGLMLFNMHHIASDGRSMGVLVGEFVTLYRSILDGKGNPLKPLTIQYADYAYWQRDWLSGEILESQLSYWDRQLADLPQVHNLPLDFERPAHNTFNGAAHHFQLDNDTLKQLNAIALENKTTLFMLIHAAFAILLSRYSNSTDIVVGTPVANRLQKELEPLIGFFVNTLVLRADCANNPSFLELLKQIKKTNLDAQSNQDVSFEHLVDRLKPNRSINHNALFQIMLSMNTNEGVALSLPNVSLKPHKKAQVKVKFDLAMKAMPVSDDPHSETNNGLYITLEYNTDLFKPKTIEHLASSLQLLFEGIADDATQTIAQLPLLRDKETRHLLNSLNDTETDYPNESCIHQLFEQQVEKTPNNIALIFEQQSLTYTQLNELSNQLAHYLIEQGIKADDIVGLCLERSEEMMVAIMAIFKAGAAYLPLDPSYPKGRLEHMINDSGLSLLLTQQNLVEMTKGQGQQLILDNHQFINSLSSYPSYNLVVEGLNSHHLAYVIYTSGSTGLPKGVMVEHQALVNRIDWMQKQYQLTENDVVLQKTPFSFDVSVWEFTWYFTVGARLIMAEPEGHKDPSYLIDVIQKNQVTTLHFVPSMFRSILADSDWSLCQSLRLVFCSGEALPVDIPELHYAMNKAILHNLYGPTEAAIDVSCWQAPDDKSLTVIPIGKPIQNIQLLVLNEQLQLQPQGSPGELFIAGVGLARGYLNQPELTAERFIKNIFTEIKGQRLYRTGDLVRYLDDGNLAFIGRVDHQVKLRGFRIELGEIEHQLSSCADINASVTVVREDKPGQKHLVAYFTSDLTAEDSLLIADIKATLQNHLPDYMVPSLYLRLESMPLSANGKIDRKNLPKPDALSMLDEYIAPTGKIEQTLVGIWAELLKIPQANISADANFFELGGHSLLSIRLLAEVRAAFACELSVREVFESPQLSEFAKQISQSESSNRPAITAVERNSKQLITSFAQQRLWFIHQMDGGSAHYNMPSAMRMHGDFKVDIAQAAFTQIIQRHEILRTIFIDGEASPLQIIQQQFEFKITQIDLTQLNRTDQDKAIDYAIKQDASQSFNLSKDLMLRVSYLHISDDEGVLLFNMHHIASDGWSNGLLVNEFVKLYRSKIEKQPNPLEPLAIQYADYAHWQRHWLSGEVLESQLSYWDEKLADLPLVHNLPLDFERPAYQTFNGASHHFKIDSNTLVQLNDIALENQATLFMLIHAAFSILLSRYSNTTDIVIATPVANRLQKELESLIGFFVNTLVLRADCANNPVFTDFLLQIKNTNLDAQANQDIPFEHLVDRINPDRSTSHNALFQIMLSMNMNTNEGSELTLPNVRLSPQTRPLVTIKFDLVLNAIPVNNDSNETEGGLYCSFTYNTDLFSAQTIARFANSMQLLLAGIATDATQAITELPLLGDEETHYLLETLNDTQVDYPDQLCVHQLFEQQVKQTPDNIAVVYEGRSLTYFELNAKANKLAHYLIDQGIRPDDFIGLCFERSLDMMVALLAILKAGAAYLPLDPSYPKDRLEYMINDSALSLLLTQQSLINITMGQGRQQLVLDNPQFQNSLNSYISNNPTVNNLSCDHLAYVIYTSGSTGKPKGVMNTHSALNNLCQWHINEYDITLEKRASHLASIGFDAAVWEIWPYLLSGSQLYLISDQIRVSPHNLLAYFRKNKITHCFLPTALLAASFELFETAENTSLEYILTGGEKLTRHSFSNSTIHLVNHYGPTESTVVTTSYRILPHESCAPPIGKPIANIRTYVLANDMSLTPNKVIGELYIAGAGLARGYLNQPELTSENFIQHTFNNNNTERLYRTGDLVRYLDDGNLEFIGRIDQQIKIRGFRIELGEIEFHLSELTQVKSSVLIAEENSNGEKNLSAYITLKKKYVSENDIINILKNALRKSIPAYMVPSFITILDKLPITQNGKIDLSVLSAMAKPLQQQKYIKPSTELEKIMVKVLAKELQIDAPTISMDANFFDMGGHSLSLLNIVNKLKDKGVQASIKSFYECETLTEVCSASIHHIGPAATESLVKLNASSKGTPVYLVHPMGGRVDCYKQLAKKLEKTAPVYGIQAPFVFDHEFSFSNLTQLAEYYATAILDNQPEGPYRLGGWSIGGLIAQHIVGVLNRKGKVVEYFAGLDSFMIMPFQRTNSDFEALKKVLAFVRKEADLDESILPKNIETQSLNKQLDIAANLINPEFINNVIKQQTIRGIKFGISIFKAKVSLSLQKINKKSVLFITEESMKEKTMIEGWENAITPLSTCDYEYVEGRHLHILQGDSSVQLADKILSDLNNIDHINETD